MSVPPLFELLKELQHGADVAERVEKYAAIDLAVVRGFGGNQFPPRVWVFGGGRQ